jgi:hypothetical protein
MSYERRGSERIEMLGTVPGATTVIQPLNIKELSRTGAQVEARFTLHIDSVHEFRLTLGERSIIVRGRVAHCHVTDVDQEGVIYRAGIEFVDTPAHASNAIGTFLDDIKAGRRG